MTINVQKNQVIKKELENTSLKETKEKFGEVLTWIMLQENDYELWKEYEINWKVHIAVAYTYNDVLWLKCQTILKNAKRRGNIIQKKQKNWKVIQLVPKAFIESLLVTYEPWQEYKIDKVMYVWISKKIGVYSIKWQTILWNIKNNDDCHIIIKWRQKNGQVVQLVPVDYIRNLNKK